MNKDPISNTFNLPEIFGVDTKKEEIINNATTNESLDKFPEDFARARENIIDTLKRTNGAIGEMAELAQVSQHHLYYKTLGELLRTNIEASKELLNLQKQAREIEKIEGKNIGGDMHVNNAVFVGSTSELLSVIRKNDND